jgi:hypothetical protein
MASTVDVLAGSEEIVEHLEYCRIRHTDYGSGHRPIPLSYLGGMPPGATQRRKRLYKDANWAEIRMLIGDKIVCCIDWLRYVVSRAAVRLA